MAGPAAALSARGNIGVWLTGDDDPAALAPSLASLSMVAIDFPKFTDGRGYSIAYLLRSRFGFGVNSAPLATCCRISFLYETRGLRRLRGARRQRHPQGLAPSAASRTPIKAPGTTPCPRTGVTSATGRPRRANHEFRRAAARADLPASTESRAGLLASRLKDIAGEFRNVAFASSLGAEDVVVVDAIYSADLPIAIFTLDTGRLPRETLELLERMQVRYARSPEIFHA